MNKAAMNIHMEVLGFWVCSVLFKWALLWWHVLVCSLAISKFGIQVGFLLLVRGTLFAYR